MCPADAYLCTWGWTYWGWAQTGGKTGTTILWQDCDFKDIYTIMIYPYHDTNVMLHLGLLMWFALVLLLWLSFFPLLSPGLYWCPIWHLHPSRRRAGGKQRFPSLPHHIFPHHITSAKQQSRIVCLIHSCWVSGEMCAQKGNPVC